MFLRESCDSSSVIAAKNKSPFDTVFLCNPPVQEETQKR